MPLTFKLDLTSEQIETLREMQLHHPLPYCRERATALLKVAKGTPIAQVARSGLLKARKPHTVGEWVARYQAQGLAGLFIAKGRGRKPAFFPSLPE